MEELLDAALDGASAAGASYADVRVADLVTESLTVQGPVVEALDRSRSRGYGVRVLVDGAWGFAATPRLDASEAARTAVAAVEIARASATARSRPVELVPEPVHRDFWATEVAVDPFEVPLESRVGLLASATEVMGRVGGVKLARGTMDLLRQRSWFASSEGSAIDQIVVQTGAGIEATAIAGSEVQTRSYPGSFRGHYGSGGYEIVEAMALAEHAERTAEEAVALVNAPECPSGRTTVVLDGHQVMLQVHLGELRYGSDLVNIVSDATLPGGLGSYGYDDEGVEAQRTSLVEEGILVGLQTSRETAAAAGKDRSNGTMRADGWENFPLIRMTNVSLLPHEGSLEDLIADVDEGIYMATNKSWSIDDKRKNFQFGCEIAWEIKNGRLGRMLRNPRYTGITTEFWFSCDAIAGADEWRVWGTPNCGKGQPGQTIRVGHGASPARFRHVATGFSQ
jgi:TldD protein